MEVQTKYSVEDVLKIVMTLPIEDREIIEKEIQKVTDEFTEKIDKLLEEKEKELMTL